MKNIFYVLLSVLLIASCNTSNQANAIQEDNKKLIQLFFENFNKHDWVSMANMYAETAEFKDPSFGKDVIKQTHQQIINKYKELQSVFPDLHDQVTNFYPSGDKHVIVEFISTGTAADRSTFELPICTIFTIQNGVILKDYTYYDNFEEQ
jgi:ketosteroid isomerase-like protein